MNVIYSDSVYISIGVYFHTQ